MEEKNEEIEELVVDNSNGDNKEITEVKSDDPKQKQSNTGLKIFLIILMVVQVGLIGYSFFFAEEPCNNTLPDISTYHGD